MPERIEVPNKTIQLPPQKPVQGKRGRSKAINQDVAPKRQRKQNNKNSELVNVTQQQVERHQVNKQNSHPTSTVHSISDVGTSERPDDIVLGNNEPSQGVQEISINYIDSGESYDRKTTIVDIYFAETIAEIIQNNPYPKTMAEYKKRSDWNKWKEAIQPELASLTKRKVFSSVMPTPSKIFPVGFKWVFVRKRNEKNEVVRYKARLVAQGFTQRPGIDFNETYSPVMSGIIFRYLIALAVQNHLSMQLMDVVTAYLYGSLDSDIYMKVPMESLFRILKQVATHIV